MANYNQDAVRLVKPYVDDTATEKSAAAVAVYIKGKADSLPAAADFIGQLFVKTGATDPGLYVATGTTTPGWKAVEHAS